MGRPLLLLSLSLLLLISLSLLIRWTDVVNESTVLWILKIKSCLGVRLVGLVCSLSVLLLCVRTLVRWVNPGLNVLAR